MFPKFLIKDVFLCAYLQNHNIHNPARLSAFQYAGGYTHWNFKNTVFFLPYNYSVSFKQDKIFIRNIYPNIPKDFPYAE